MGDAEPDEPEYPSGRDGPEPPLEYPVIPTSTRYETTGPKGRSRGHAHRAGRKWIEWGVVIGLAAVAAVLIKVFMFQSYLIPSTSMVPTLKVGDKVYVNKLDYDFHSVHRGDIVVFTKPPGLVDQPGVVDLIKRVIGLPGETITAHNGAVYIDGHQLIETWLPQGVTTGDFGPVTIPAGDYFVMGDNRGDSADSRVFGPIPQRLIVGRAFMIVWPPSRWRGL
ncbi:MAG: signal peptidase I [Acidobacteriota bacterium]|nr:signal peptidase I [Acidobacteriota bacterium]